MNESVDRYEVESIAEDKARQARWDAEKYADEAVRNLRQDIGNELDWLKARLDQLENNNG